MLPGTEQAIGRAHRCGQKQSVTVHRYLLIDPDSIEQHVCDVGVGVAVAGVVDGVDGVVDGVIGDSIHVPTLRLFLKHLNKSERQKN